jgi:hypothetical protein
MRRKNRFEIFVAARDRGPYDEFPMLEGGIDPQLHLSRNAIPQPFFLICEQDSMIAQLAGDARVEFRGSSVVYFDMELGDYVYVPAGTPHRIVPKSPSIHVRYKAADPGLEAVAWYDGDSSNEVARVTWDCALEIPQEAYLRACAARGIDVSPYRWAEVAADIRETEAAERTRPAKDADAAKVPRPRNATTIGPPNGSKAPLKNNVYLHARIATTALAPLFPYLGPGCIVPATALQDPDNRGGMGYFVHSNTVREVNISFGAQNSYQVPGGAATGPYVHGVGQKAGQENAKMINVAVITQRQAVDEPQHEAVGLVCEKCGETVFHREYDAYSLPDTLDGEVDEAMIGLPTISQSAKTTADYNASEATRTCPKCGHVNAPFPSAYWGWDEYRRRTQVIALAKSLMREAGATALETV